MLEAGKKIDAMNKLELINIVSVPHMKGNVGRKVSDMYSKILMDEQKATPEVIKRDREALLRKLRSTR